MAAVSRVITLDIGTCTAKLAEFQVTGGQLMLLRLGVRELGLDPNKEENRFPSVADAVRQLMAETGTKPGIANISVSGQSVFIRYVKLPPVDAAQVKEVIGFEAQQNVPFPIHEVVWDYQLTAGRTATGECEAIIVAMKADLLETENRAAETAGLRTKVIDVSPLALYNAFRYNYGIPAETTLLIDMGARTTNLLFVEGGHLYTRGIPIAGNMLSQNIGNELQEPFAAAETLKKGKGFVHLGGAYADPDDRDAARISKLIRSTFTRLHNELNRSISFYRSQQGGSAPKRILLTGGTSQLPYVDVFLGEKLNLPVEFFNPFRNVAMGPGLDVDVIAGQSCFAGELVGLAARDTGACPIEITLTPPELKEKQAKSRKQPSLYAALVAIAALAALFSLANLQEAAIANKMADSIQGKADGLQQFNTEVQVAAKESDYAKRQYDAVAKLVAQRDDWLEMLEDINRVIPEGMWITVLEPKYNASALGVALPPAPPASGPASTNRSGPQLPPEVTTLEIQGLYHSHKDTYSHNQEILNEFLNRLGALKWFSRENSKVDLAPVQGSAEQPYAIEFKVIVALKKPIDIKP
jgi:type IV pilus assembly protein PilM